MKIAWFEDHENIIFSIGKNKDKFPRQEVIETISSSLQNTRMITTNPSAIFQIHITQLPASLHQNNVGHIHIDFKKIPITLNFFGLKKEIHTPD